MINNKKGLSTVVTTLIIILLVLVAIGIIWVVIRGVIEEGTSSIEIGTKCLELDVRATQVFNTTPMTAASIDYDVTLRRGAKGDPIGGVRILIANDTESTSVDSVGNIAILTTETRSLTNTGIANANRVEVASYFNDDGGIAQYCGQINSFNF